MLSILIFSSCNPDALENNDITLEYNLIEITSEYQRVKEYFPNLECDSSYLFSEGYTKEILIFEVFNNVGKDICLQILPQVPQNPLVSRVMRKTEEVDGRNHLSVDIWCNGSYAWECLIHGDTTYMLIPLDQSFYTDDSIKIFFNQSFDKDVTVPSLWTLENLKVDTLK